MCLAVYLASNRPLPAIDWNPKSRAFYLKQVGDKAPVLGQFTLPHVYYIGSNQGCGCGFIKDGLTPEEIGPCQGNYTSLAHTVRQALADGANLELFVCWEGSQTRPPTSMNAITPSRLEDPAFELQELSFFRIRHDADPALQ